METDKNNSSNQLQIPEIFKGKLFIDPRYDEAFKILFNDKKLLIHFLNGILKLENETQITDIDYLPQENIAGFTDAVVSGRFDIIARTQSEEYINIEIQQQKHAFWKDRVLLYNALLMLQAKKDWNDKQKTKHGNKSHYVPRVVSIWVCDFKQGSTSHFHDEWMLYSKNEIEKRVNILPVTNGLSYIFLELPKFRKHIDELTTIEDKWLYLLKTAGDLRSVPKMNDELFDLAYTRLRVDKQNQVTLLKLAESMVTQAEINDCKTLALQEGRQEGREAGRNEKAREMAREMLKDKASIRTISKYTGLSEEEILKL
ncbi:MAG: Rpn family recombination-promoting nuclease/putative transposase [Fibrobacter sp.]|nr:Rpn family recombination-promoting nuclease/putative transposase [Fibrobacter sp.]